MKKESRSIQENEKLQKLILLKFSPPVKSAAELIACGQGNLEKTLAVFAEAELRSRLIVFDTTLNQRLLFFGKNKKRKCVDAKDIRTEDCVNAD